MTTLEVLNDSSPYRFKSLGILNEGDGADFLDSIDFPIGAEYKLSEGKFPLESYKDTFSESGLYHTLNENIKVKIIEFEDSCLGNQFNESGNNCRITVEKVNKETLSGGNRRRKKTLSRRKKGGKNKSKRKKSKSRKSKR